MRHALYRVFIAMSLTYTAAFGQACLHTPEEAALLFYADYRDFLFAPKPNAPLTESFAKLVTTSYEEQSRQGTSGPIDWDFWNDAQDGTPGAKATVRAASGDKHNSTITLSYPFSTMPSAKPTTNTASVLLVKNAAGCWRVDDLRRNNRSVRTILESSAQKSRTKASTRTPH